MGLPISPSVGGVEAFLVAHPAQLTGSNTTQGHKVYPGIKGRVILIVPQPGVITYSTVPTDLDLTVYKSGTALHATAIPLMDSSTLDASPGTENPTLSATAATVAIADTDYLSIDYVLTGGSTFTLNGTGVIVHIARE